MKSEEERHREFLLGLTQLTRDTGVAIGGCGCCGSPFLYDASSPSDPESGYGYEGEGNVAWISHSDTYKWDAFRDSIVRSMQSYSGADHLGKKGV